jgi:hypothetical protein
VPIPLAIAKNKTLKNEVQLIVRTAEDDSRFKAIKDEFPEII